MSSEPKLTNETVSAAVMVFHREQGQAIVPLMPDRLTPPDPPKAEGWKAGSLSMELANRLGAEMLVAYHTAIFEELAAACGVSHNPADKQKRGIEKILEARLTEAAKNIDTERHAAWFRDRHTGAFTRTIRLVLGRDVDVHYSPAGAPVKIRKKAAAHAG